MPVSTIAVVPSASITGVTSIEVVYENGTVLTWDVDSPGTVTTTGVDPEKVLRFTGKIHGEGSSGSCEIHVGHKDLIFR